MDHDELVNRRVHAIARAHDCSIDDVNAALDRHPIELNCDADLKRALALELMPAAGGLLIKVAERRATLLGLNPPIGHAVASDPALRRRRRRRPVPRKCVICSTTSWASR